MKRQALKKKKVGGRNDEVKQEEILNTVNRLQKQQTSDPQESNNRLRNELFQMYCISCAQVEQQSSARRNVQPISVCRRARRLRTQMQ